MPKNRNKNKFLKKNTERQNTPESVNQAEVTLENATTLHKPIFYDETKLRWKIFLTFIAGFILTFVGLQVMTVRSILNQSNTFSPPKTFQPLVADVAQSIASQIDQIATTSNKVVPIENLKRIGFYVTWDETSFKSLEQHIHELDVVMPEWLVLSSLEGSYRQLDWKDEESVRNFIRFTKPDTKIIPLINNFNSEKHDYDAELLAGMLKNPQSRANLIGALTWYVNENRYDGINIDFENVPQTSQKNLELFMSELNTEFKKHDLIVSQSLPLNNPQFNYATYSRYNDYIVLMAYDYNWLTGNPGPIAPQNWINDSLNSVLRYIPKEKLILSIGNYAYDWNLTTKQPAWSMSFENTMFTAARHQAKIEMDKSSLNPFYNYKDSSGNEHIVWYLDSITAFNQIVAGANKQIAGVALWRLGSEDTGFWKIFESKNNAYYSLENLQNIVNGYSVSSSGEGEVLRVISSPRAGLRRIQIDPVSGYINSQSISSYPSSYTVERSGRAAGQKKIALTFDDGPSPEHTMQILDILDQYGAKGTFFIIGSQANIYPDIIKSIVERGHEIGNHTYLHPNISLISKEQINLELKTTQKVIESFTGRQTLLFRPPYGGGFVNFDHPEMMQPMADIGEKGFYFVGIDIDPKDWRRVSSNEISGKIISDVYSGKGPVVLLHDGGGNRTNTVEALPRILEELTGAGYTFTGMSDVMGLSRDIVMPETKKGSFSFDSWGFRSLSITAGFIRWAFWIGIFIGFLRLVLIIILALTQKFSRAKKLPKETSRRKLNAFLPKVSVIVPAWNEEKVIIKTIKELLRSKYKNFEVLFVDDGSKDNTYQIVLDKYKDNPQVKIFTKKNGGKSSAINFGIDQSDAEIVIVQDADTLLDPKAIFNLTRHFIDEKVGAVAGNVKVGNRISMLTKFQALEYIISQNLDKRAFNLVNGISVVPGAIGAWKRDLVLKAGGFKSDTLAEDAELTLKILEMGYKVEYEEQAIAFTEAPDNMKDFIKQRFRWMFGTLQSTWKYFKHIFSHKHKSLGFFVIPNVLVFQIIFPLIAPFMDIFTVVFLSIALWQKAIHQDVSFDSANQVITFYLLFALVDILVAFIAFMLERKEDKKLIIFLPWQRIVYKYLMYVLSLKVFFTALKGPRVEWETKDRKATVNFLAVIGR